MHPILLSTPPGDNSKTRGVTFFRLPLKHGRPERKHGDFGIANIVWGLVSSMITVVDHDKTMVHYDNFGMASLDPGLPLGFSFQCR